jgi:YgiT-type zinc finger domain-containing protein
MHNSCYFCKGKVVKMHITVDYRWGDDLVVIKDVPAGICQQCGEKYLESAVYKDLERLARNKSHVAETMSVDVLPYETRASV